MIRAVVTQETWIKGQPVKAGERVSVDATTFYLLQAGKRVRKASPEDERAVSNQPIQKGK